MRFPALLFKPPDEVETCPDADHFSVASTNDFRFSSLVGMVIVDSDQHAWSVRSVTKLREIGAFWSRLVSAISRQHQYLVRYDLVDLGNLSLADIKGRILAAMDANPEAWWDDEVIAGEAGPPVYEEDFMANLRKEVQEAQDMSALFAMEGNRPEGGSIGVWPGGSRRARAVKPFLGGGAHLPIGGSSGRKHASCLGILRSLDPGGQWNGVARRAARASVTRHPDQRQGGRERIIASR